MLDSSYRFYRTPIPSRFILRPTRPSHLFPSFFFLFLLLFPSLSALPPWLGWKNLSLSPFTVLHLLVSSKFSTSNAAMRFGYIQIARYFSFSRSICYVDSRSTPFPGRYATCIHRIISNRGIAYVRESQERRIYSNWDRFDTRVSLPRYRFVCYLTGRY